MRASLRAVLPISSATSMAMADFLVGLADFDRLLPVAARSGSGTAGGVAIRVIFAESRRPPGSPGHGRAGRESRPTVRFEHGTRNRRGSEAQPRVAPRAGGVSRDARRAGADG